MHRGERREGGGLREEARGGVGGGGKSPTQERCPGDPQLDNLLRQESACSSVHLQSLKALRDLKG